MSQDKKPTLNAGQRHMLRLISKEQQNPEGWAPVSATVFPLIKGMPEELVELHAVGDAGRGRARLKTAGESLVEAMAWGLA